MDPITIAAIAVFLSPFLQKGGEKLVEKTVETLFDSRKDLARKFTGLFKQEIISLNLNSVSTQEIAKQLEANPEIKAEVDKKVAANQDLLSELTIALNDMFHLESSAVTINTEKIAEKIAQVNINTQNVSQTIENF